MANLFEQPIAATPISEFAALPLQYMERSLLAKQDRHNTNKAAIDNMITTFGSVSANPLDRQRRNELIDEFENPLEEFVDRAEGDYSSANGFVDQMTTKFKQAMSSGELGAIDKAAKRAAEEGAQLKEDGNRRAYAMHQRRVGSHQTAADDFGDFNSFNTYSPSNVEDPTKALLEVAKTVESKYNEFGDEDRSPEAINQMVHAAMLQNPEIERAMQENFLLRTGKLAHEAPEDWNSFKGNLVGNVAIGLSKHKWANPRIGRKPDSGSGVDSSGRRMVVGERANVFTGGIDGTTATGGSVSWLSELTGMKTGELLGWAESPEGSEELKRIAEYSGVEVPTTMTGITDLLEDAYEKQVNKNLVYAEIVDDPALTKQYITSDGTLVKSGQIRDLKGNVVENPGDLFAKTKEGKVGLALGLTKPGTGQPFGTLVLKGNDNKTYLQEPSELSILSDPKYLVGQVQSATGGPTGSGTVRFNSSITYKDKSNRNRVYMPAGSYKVKKMKDGTVEFYNFDTPPKKVAVMDKNNAIKQIK